MKEESATHWQGPEAYNHFTEKENALLGKLQRASDLADLKEVFVEIHKAVMVRDMSQKAYEHAEKELVRLALVNVTQMLKHKQHDKQRNVVKEYVERIFNPEENNLYERINREAVQLVNREYPEPRHDHNSL